MLEHFPEPEIFLICFQAEKNKINGFAYWLILEREVQDSDPFISKRDFILKILTEVFRSTTLVVPF